MTRRNEWSSSTRWSGSAGRWHSLPVFPCHYSVMSSSDGLPGLLDSLGIFFSFPISFFLPPSAEHIPSANSSHRNNRWISNGSCLPPPPTVVVVTTQIGPLWRPFRSDCFGSSMSDITQQTRPVGLIPRGNDSPWAQKKETKQNRSNRDCTNFFIFSIFTLRILSSGDSGALEMNGILSRRFEGM